MNLQTKKLIAREFIILIIAIGLGLIAFILTYPYNLFMHHKINNIEIAIHEKTNLVDSLSKQFNNKTLQQKWLFENLNNEFDLGVYNTTDKLWERQFELVTKDSINIIWNKSKDVIEYIHKIGFNSSESLQEFIKTNKIDKIDIENKEKSDSIKQEMSSLKREKGEIENSVFAFSQQINFGIYTLGISGLLLFVFRYIVYAIQWSLKTLKQK